MVKNEDVKVRDDIHPMLTSFKDVSQSDDEEAHDAKVSDPDTQQNDLPIQNPPLLPAVNDPMDEDSQPIVPKDLIMDLTQDN